MTYICTRSIPTMFFIDISLSLFIVADSTLPSSPPSPSSRAFDQGGAVHTFTDNSSAQTNESLSPAVTAIYFHSLTSAWKFPCNDKDNSHVSLYSQDSRSSLTHPKSDAITQRDDLTSEAPHGPAPTNTYCPCYSYRRQEDKAQREHILTKH